MAFTNGIRSPPQGESSFPAYNRPIGSQPSNSAVTSTPHERASLHRRFTTNQIPTLPTLSSMTPLSPIGQQRRQAAESTSDIASVVSNSKCYNGYAQNQISSLNKRLLECCKKALCRQDIWCGHMTSCCLDLCMFVVVVWRSVMVAAAWWCLPRNRFLSQQTIFAPPSPFFFPPHTISYFSSFYWNFSLCH